MATNRQVLTAEHRHTMATAVCGIVTRATSDEFSGFAKIKPVFGQSPLVPCLHQHFILFKPPERAEL